MVVFLELRYRIGFETTAYTVSEDEGSVVVNVRVITGVLDERVRLFVDTIDGTATGTYNYSVCE